jgi:hypothetical protein
VNRCAMCEKNDPHVTVTVEATDSLDVHRAHRHCLASMLAEMSRIVREREASRSADIKEALMRRYR